MLTQTTRQLASRKISSSKVLNTITVQAIYTPQRNFTDSNNLFMKEAQMASNRPDLTPKKENRSYDPVKESSKQEIINLFERSLEHVRSHPDITKRDTSQMISSFGAEETLYTSEEEEDFDLELLTT
jgi:hypothetical protein